MIEVDLYQDKQTGKALATNREQSIENEILEHELMIKKEHAEKLGLRTLTGVIEKRLGNIQHQRLVAFPLLSEREISVWSRFLPRIYSTSTAVKAAQWCIHQTGYRFIGPIHEYQFDIPPLSVLELWKTLTDQKTFDLLEIWTPERPRPEPILVGYRARTDEKEYVGPFLLAQWGESLEPFEEIEKKVLMIGQTTMNQTIQFVPQQLQQQSGQVLTLGGWINPTTNSGSITGWSGFRV